MGASIFFAAAMILGGRNMNYDEKQLTGRKKFELFLLSVQSVS
jgi:hypothetical protein